MTDKQIIIHNVDVSECKKYEHEIIRCNTSLKNMCFYGGRCTDKKNADCYYKQLKRKEQECEILKMSENEGIEIIAELKAECEELKKEIKHYKQIAQYHGNLSVKYTNKSAKLKQTITEIKEIAECCQTPDNCKDYCKFYNECIEGGLHLILQKISECEINYENL